MKEEKMNNNQITFCQEYVKNGLNGTQAYLKAYKTCKKEDTAKVNASRLLTNANIQSYIKELQEKIEDEAIMTAKERMKWLSEVIKDIQREEIKIKLPDGSDETLYMKNADLNTKLKAIDTLNKMTGEYKTILDGKVDIKKLEDLL